MSPPLCATEFERRFKRLILAAWMIPPVFGLSFLLYIRMFTPEQMLTLLTTPLEPAFVLGTLAIAVWYFSAYIAPVTRFLAVRDPADADACLSRMRRFPVHFWGLFLGYLLLAPASVIVSAEIYAGFVARPVDWFRIHLVALIVSIIVGLPIFFLILDLFGRALGDLVIERPQVSLRVKVFLIGALTPLLIDTMLVQYYWSRTGYFTAETFTVWLTLEVLAVIGAIMFVRSIGQSLEPLQGVLDRPLATHLAEAPVLQPRSTDEMGVLAGGYRALLQTLGTHRRLLQITRLLVSARDAEKAVGAMVQEILDLCRATLGAEHAILALNDEAAGTLVAVAHTGSAFDPAGHFELSTEPGSPAGTAMVEGRPAVLHDLPPGALGEAALDGAPVLRALLIAPLLAEGRRIGVLISATASERWRFSGEQVQLMEAFAQETALAVHAYLLERQRREAEEARLEREEQVRLLLESTEEGIFGIDLNGDCTFANRACLRFLGYEREEQLLGRNMHRLMHHTRADGTPYPAEECAVRRVICEGDTVHSRDEVNWRSDGTSFPVEYWARPIHKGGEIIGGVVAFIDITERKRAEQAMQGLLEYNRLLLESTSDGIFGVDTALRCTFVNRAAARMLGYRPQELQGREMPALVHHAREMGEPRAPEESFIARTVREDRHLEASDDVLWHRSGKSFPVHYTASPLHENGRVTGAVVVFRDIAEARDMARRMDYLATHDTLTGLVNRREFERRLEQALESARADRERHVMCYLDLDQFKVVNDTCGHVAGDELLRQLSTVLQRLVRRSDTLGRLGGDEFGVLLERCPLPRALELAQDLRAGVQDFRFVWEDKTFSLGVSIGLTEIDAHTQGVAAALSRADAACYAAKDSGRNRVHVYESDDSNLQRRQGEMQWAARIHHALGNGGLTLVYQKIVPVRPQGGPPHVEILLRMRNGDDEPVLPGAFVPAAERFDLMPSLDRWVVRETFECLGHNRGLLDSLGWCGINLSGQSIGNHELLEFIVAELRRTAIPAHKICFELTETAAISNLSQAVRFMGELREHGFRFALDDFGSGMSSFAYLKNLPVDYLKIDGNFVRDLIDDPVDRAMVEAINQVGHVMNIETIAEFVERPAILAELRAIGVDYAQGYGIAAPEPLSGMPAELELPGPTRPES